MRNENMVDLMKLVECCSCSLKWCAHMATLHPLHKMNAYIAHAHQVLAYSNLEGRQTKSAR